MSRVCAFTMDMLSFVGLYFSVMVMGQLAFKILFGIVPNSKAFFVGCWAFSILIFRLLERGKKGERRK